MTTSSGVGPHHCDRIIITTGLETNQSLLPPSMTGLVTHSCLTRVGHRTLSRERHVALPARGSLLSSRHHSCSLHLLSPSASGSRFRPESADPEICQRLTGHQGILRTSTDGPLSPACSSAHRSQADGYGRWPTDTRPSIPLQAQHHRPSKDDAGCMV